MILLESVDQKFLDKLGNPVFSFNLQAIPKQRIGSPKDLQLFHFSLRRLTDRYSLVPKSLAIFPTNVTAPDTLYAFLVSRSMKAAPAGFTFRLSFKPVTGLGTFNVPMQRKPTRNRSSVRLTLVPMMTAMTMTFGW